MSDRPTNGHSTPADAERLLGGYATNTLTDAERTALFEAALTDQRLFDALADEDALRELLVDKDARAQLLASIKPAAPTAPAQGWWAALLRPRTLVLASSMAVALLIAVMIRPIAQQPPHMEHARPTAAEPVKQKADQPPVAADKAASTATAYAAAEGVGKKVPAAPERAPGPPPPAVIKEEVAATFGNEARQEKSAEAKSRDGERELAKVGQVAPAPAAPAGVRLKDESARADESAGNRGRAAAVEQDRQNAAAAPNKSSNQMAQTLGASQDLRAQAAFRRIAGGAITAVDSDTVTINAGRDQSLAPHDILEVRRGAALLGEIELTEVEGSSSKGKLRGAFTPKPGDTVARKPPQ